MSEAHLVMRKTGYTDPLLPVAGRGRMAIELNNNTFAGDASAVQCADVGRAPRLWDEANHRL